MSNLALYKIADEYQSIIASMYDEETGEISESALSNLDKVNEAIENKAIAVASYIKNMEAERSAIENAKKEMAARESRLERREEFLRSYLLNNLERTGKTEISCPYFVIKLKKNPVSTDIIDESLIPSQYKKSKEVISIDKVKIKSDIQSGIDVPGATLKQNLKLEIK